MNWCDEKYVKLYTRQTATWRLWPWQARCVFPLLIQVANGAGLLDVGGKDPLTGLAVLIMVPRDVVEPAVSALLADGTLEQVATGFLVPKYLEAQEARKTDSRKKADQRDRERDKARGIVRSPVTECHPVSPPVPLQPSPAQPSPEKKNVEQARLGPVETQAKAIDALSDDEFAVFEHWRVVMGHPRAVATPARKRLIAKALQWFSVGDLQLAIDGCARRPWNMGNNPQQTRYDSLELILRDAKHIEDFIGSAKAGAA